MGGRRSKFVRLWLCLIGLLLAIAVSRPCLAQEKPEDSSRVQEMLITREGFLVVDTPKGWVRTDGPGLAFFVRKRESRETARVWIYISSDPIGPKAEAKSLDAYIQSDVGGFKERFKNGLAQNEKPLDLPRAKRQVPVVTFKSGEEHNAFEQVIYIEEIGRVFTFVLSAKSEGEFAKSLPVFREFAKSYGGSIILDPDAKQP